ncbi:putative exported repeat protein [Faustovirus]|nr:MORN repeat-containing protein [Faustovirus]AMN83355.1 putative exported repeat protein [Faustovirus]AMN84339.1 putative exported repeat protein [Faustovirus]AMN85325.1 putative exported repeat protein [Faustovirus]QBR99321.1 toxin-antitoxin system YwqK family protein [Faustovirus mariensis]
MEINRSEECVEIVDETIVVYTRNPKGMKHGNCVGRFIDSEMLSLSCNYVDDLLDGLYTTYHENGLQKQVGCYSMGKRDGVFVTYNDTGDEIERCEYVLDLLQGVKVKREFDRETTTFYVDGLREGEEVIRNWLYDYIYEIRNYKADKLNGLCKCYFQNGKLRSTMEYVDGVKDGIETTYFGSDKSEAVTQRIAEFVCWKNGKKNGLRSIYYSHQDGVMKTIPYINDLIEGIVIKYFGDGKVKSTKNYTNNVKHGECKSYDYSGALLKSYNCVNGVKSGEFTHFHDNGKISAKGVYSGDKYDGLVYRYYPNGNIESIKKYLTGSKNGHQVYYYENGRKSLEYTLYRGKLHNVRTEYYPHGGFQSRTLYDNGARVWIEEYRANGSMMSYSEYFNEKLHGEVINYYDIDVDKKRVGLIWMKSQYADGKHVHTTSYHPNGKVKYDAIKF